MKPTHIEHIGIAVANLEESISYYEKVLGLECYAIEEVTDQKVRTAFFRVGDTKIELLESTDPEGPIGKFIEKKGPGIHHLAFAMDNVGESLKHAQEQLEIALVRRARETMNSSQDEKVVFDKMVDPRLHLTRSHKESCHACLRGYESPLLDGRFVYLHLEVLKANLFQFHIN